MKELDIMKSEIEEVKNENHSLAFDIIKDLKRIIYFLIFVILITNALWIFAVTNFDFSYDEISQEQTDTENSSMIGEIN